MYYLRLPQQSAPFWDMTIIQSIDRCSNTTGNTLTGILTTHQTILAIAIIRTISHTCWTRIVRGTRWISQSQGVIIYDHAIVGTGITESGTTGHANNRITGTKETDQITGAFIIVIAIPITLSTGIILATVRFR